MTPRIDSGALWRTILLGGTATAILDGLNSVVMFRLLLGLDVVQIYQFVASGVLGPSAYSGGASSTLLGLLIHCAVAFGAAATFTAAAIRWPSLVMRPALNGAVFGICVYAIMNYVIIPLSLIGPSEFSPALFASGIVGHIAFVGWPITFAARRYLGAKRKRGDVTSSGSAESRGAAASGSI